MTATERNTYEAVRNMLQTTRVDDVIRGIKYALDDHYRETHNSATKRASACLALAENMQD